MQAWTQEVPGRQRQAGPGWWYLPWSLVAGIALALALSPSIQAATFMCGAGDVNCLLAAINEANAHGKTNTIGLEPGTYTLRTVDDSFAGSGLPMITSTLTIQGAGAETTIIERDASTLERFRLLEVSATGNLTLTGLTLRGGETPDWGGGIANSGTLTLTHCALTDNTGGLGGGGIFNLSGTVTLTHCTLAHNSGVGGGMTNFGTAMLTHCTLTDNMSFPDGGDGGGGFLNYGTVTLTNSTLAHNTAWIFGGGGLYNSGTATLTNCTLTDNTVVLGGDRNIGGGGLYNRAGSTTLQNTILARNTAPGVLPPAEDCFGVITSLGANLIGDPTGCTLTPPKEGSDLTGDAGLGEFTDTDIPGTGHVPLLSTSQAIDASNDGVCSKLDQLGQKRVNVPGVGTSRCDIGAIEFQR